MSRDPYSSGSGVVGPGGGTRSPRSGRRLAELPTVDRSPSRSYASGRGSPLGRKRVTRSGNNSPEHLAYGSFHHHQLVSPYYSRDEDLASPVMLEERGRSMSTGGGGGGGHHRSRSASRPAMSSSAGMSARYTSLDRASAGILDHDREFVPIREPRERSRDRGLYLEDELYGSRSARQSPNPHMLRDSGGYIGELQHQNNDLQRELGNLKKELELTNQKLGSSMHSIKTFWSPELKKERALRKEESTKYSLINEQLKLLNSENQKQSMMVRQLEEELRLRMRGPSVEIQQQMEVLYNENEHLTREIAILRDTIRELEMRIETQKQTLQARDESIKKLLEMLQNKGMGKEEERIMFQQMQSMAQKQLDELRTEVQRRDQELLAMSAKMKTLDEQHQDYQRHITVLKDSLCAKEEHYNMMQSDLEEMRQRLEEKNRMIEKKTQAAMQAQQERNRMNTELTELKDHMDIKDRKINVLQRKLDLREANQKLKAGAAKGGADSNQERKQLEDHRRQLEEQRRQMEERAKSVDQKARTIEEKERTLQSLDQDLKKRKAKMDQLEQQLQRSGGSPDKRLAEMQKALETAEKELEKAKEASERSTAETERLLQLVQMTQEEQNSKEKQIRELQDALKSAQAKLKQAATAQQQEDSLDELKGVMETRSRKKDDWRNQNLPRGPCNRTQEERDDETSSWKKDLEEKNQKIAELEEEMRSMKDLLENSKEIQCSSSKDNDESWKKEVEAKNRRIVELEQVMVSLENFLKDHTDTEGIRELEAVIERKNARIEELEDTVAEFEDFLKQNPDVKELHDLRRQVTVAERRIQELESWIRRNEEATEDGGINRARIMELEELVTHLEDYVRKHNVDVLKQKLQDRECRIEQLQARVNTLEKELINLEKSPEGHETSGESSKSHVKDSSNDPTASCSDARMKELERTLSEKNEKICELEQRIVESKDRMTGMQEEMARLERELSEYEAEDIGVLKEEIRVRDERILQLEDEIDSLERAFNEGVDLEQIEELMNVIRRKEDRERQFEKDIESKRNRIEELSEALRESVVIATDGERRLQREEKMKKNALERIAKLEQRIASMQTASVLKCPTCRPLLSKLQNAEKMLRRLTEERNSQLEDLHQMKREALKAAVSEKDAHLALLELAGIKTAQQADQADKLKSERKTLLDRLKREDERSIEMSLEINPVNSDSSIQVLAQILETSDDEDKKNADENEDRVDRSISRKSEITTGSTTANSNGCDYATTDLGGREHE